MSYRASNGDRRGSTVAPPVRNIPQTYDNYHSLKHLLPHNGQIELRIVCVYCCSQGPDTDAWQAPGADTSQTLLSDGDVVCVQPCGHLAGWSCMSRDRTGRCPVCGMLWRRINTQANHCLHAFGINKLRLFADMAEAESEWLTPQVDGAYVAEQCRQCATLDALRELTRQARAEIAGSIPGGDGSCTYATDGAVHGFLEGDSLKPFTFLDIMVRPPVLSLGLMQEARAREEQIRARYEGRTPLAETKAVGEGPFVFKVAGASKAMDKHVESIQEES
ncbi:hypothetical protein S40285_10239 [Stachybotrys chlorohalonatus IBT 40285]|uniref:Uncharacterized protein n=1 Tax=Stachybotrys chlorohalonatus (strain IBT 40285) TaxID=1283841 RepID=A0A084QPJ2_STAC4|nr:hypothetical protein S40285_10239 [Stachybotrys chlorohalonata IBT 40285]